VGERKQSREASRLAANLRNWESRVDDHVASGFYDVEGLVRSRRPHLDSLTLAEVGEVAGKDRLHLQCRVPGLVRILRPMPVNVRVPGPLRRLTAGSSQVEVEGGTVAAALADLEVRFPGFRDRLYDDGGKLRQFINIYVNDADIRFGGGLDTPVAEGDDISIVPAVAGG
jgi:molybdopterin converting factor small subunit